MLQLSQSKIRPVTVLDIVHNHLLEIGADGLCNSHGCGCGLDQLVSCGNIMEDCEAAKRVKCVPQESCSCDEPSDFCYIPFNTELTMINQRLTKIAMQFKL